MSFDSNLQYIYLHRIYFYSTRLYTNFYDILAKNNETMVIFVLVLANNVSCWLLDDDQ